MIEMNLALGNFDSNPIVSSLLDSDQNDNSTGKSDVDGSANNINRGNDIKGIDCIDGISNESESTETKITSLLYKSKPNTSTDDSTPFLQERSTKRRKKPADGSK